MGEFSRNSEHSISIRCKNHVLLSYLFPLNRPYPNGHHGLCPQFFNSAFSNKFMAVPKKLTCNQRLTPRDATVIPPNMRMGYWQTLDPNYDTKEKTFYAMTTRHHPFNLYAPDNENHV